MTVCSGLTLRLKTEVSAELKGGFGALAPVLHGLHSCRQGRVLRACPTCLLLVELAQLIGRAPGIQRALDEMRVVCTHGAPHATVNLNVVSFPALKQRLHLRAEDKAPEG